jgi:diaminopimelate epimerase
MTHSIPFHKMHGLGNDFVVINAVQQPFDPRQLPIRALAHRHTGIGFDQLLLIGPSSRADFACRIFNSDGSEAEQCGNGLRCVVRYIQETGLSHKKTLLLETTAGVFEAVIREDNLIQVTLGVPHFQSEQIPSLTDTVNNIYEIELNPKTRLPLMVLSLGNPHAILRVDTVENFPVSEMGQQIATHPVFPQGTNVGFMEIIDSQHIRLRTFERGVGETLACGSNACATVIAGILNHSLHQKVNVQLPLGELWIEWEGKNNPVKMIGPATTVFKGTL